MNFSFLFFSSLKKSLTVTQKAPVVYIFSYIKKKTHITKIQKNSTSYRAVISILFILYHFFIFFQTHRIFSNNFIFSSFCNLQQKHRKEIVARLRIWSKFTFARNSCQRNHAMREGSLLCICFKQTGKAKCCIYLFIYLSYNLWAIFIMIYIVGLGFLKKYRMEFSYYKS